MQCLRSVEAMRDEAKRLEAAGKRIGLVPTMGYLHEGHLDLMRQLRPHCDSLWVSIFVNPAQFAPTEDLDRYPRDLERDLELCEAQGVHGVFAPEVQAMYPKGFDTWVEPGELGSFFCGASRPGHFRGVLTVVLRLFMLTRCAHSIFGRKDAQQLFLIQKMVHDLNLPVKILAGETLRETDGLAMSSRNRFLSADERQAACVLQESLCDIKKAMRAGSSLQVACDLALKRLALEKEVDLEYLHAVTSERFRSVLSWERSSGKRVEAHTNQSAQAGLDSLSPLILLIAARLGQTRLIDNIRIEKDEK
jgi:pantoate--beta-alanine ligase